MSDRPSSALQSVSLDQVVIGMFVVELDIPWIDSPFLSHARKIKSAKEIESLRRAGVKNLVIDTRKGPSASPVAELNPLEPDRVAPVAPETEVPLATSLEQEMGAARKLRGEVNRVVADLFDQFERELPVDANALHPLIDDTLKSLARNNQALLSLAHLSRKSQKLNDHAFSVFCLALNLGVVLGVDAVSLKHLGAAALLHEAGWVQLPLNLMGKRTRYTPAEKQLVAQHVSIGCKLLLASELPPLVYRIIEEHHERGDGSGYPSQLRLADMHPLSQILALVDEYDERVHQLHDGPGILPRNAIQALYKDSKSGLYDGKVLAAFVTLLGGYPVSSAVQLSNGSKGVVIENVVREHITRVKLYYDSTGKPLKEAQLVQLKEPPDDGLTIEKLLDLSSNRDDPYGLLVWE
jgi:HD-GYP domain-containing protein (c-di-GMP phosphodiesterase class II)